VENLVFLNADRLGIVPPSVADPANLASDQSNFMQKITPNICANTP
jgi:hypothetical protein